MKNKRTAIIVLLSMILILSCSNGRVMKKADIADVVEGLRTNDPLTGFLVRNSEEKVRKEFLKSLSENISNNSDASACALFSRIDSADEYFDEILDDGTYKAVLVWHSSGMKDGKELLRKEFYQDSDGRWSERVMEPYHSQDFFRYSISEIHFDGASSRDIDALLERSELTLPATLNLESITYGYNLIVSKETGEECVNSRSVMYRFSFTDGTEAENYVDYVIQNQNGKTGIVSRVSIVNNELFLMLMEAV